MKKISVIGAGSWGTALAVLLGEKGFDVKLWARREELANDIESKKENIQYLPGIKIPDAVIADSSMKNILENSEIIIISVPSEFFRDVVGKIKPYFNSQIIVSATKGVEHTTCKRMSQIIEDVLGKSAKIAVLSGPNHAEEVSTKKPTASVVASKEKRISKIIAECLCNSHFKLYQLSDVAGVEVCGAFKNISAIATGVCDGFGFGDNARASMMTLGLMEMNKFGRHFGAKRGTVYGLAGVGDLIATCTSKHSRNRFLGENLAKGKTFEEIKKDMRGMVAEGVLTTKAVYEYGLKHNIKMHLVEETYKVLFENKNINKAVSDLLNLI